MVLKKSEGQYITQKYLLFRITKILHHNIFQKTVRTIDTIVKYVCFFLRAYLLYQFKNDEELIHIDRGVLDIVIHCITKKSIAGPPSKKQAILRQTLMDFYNNHFAELTLNFAQYHSIEDISDYEFFKIDKKNLSQILNYSQTEIITNIENNIKLHFLDHLRHFVNQTFKEQNNQILDKLKTKRQKTDCRKRLTAELTKVKNDLINCTLLSEQKYHLWINTYRNILLPNQTDKTLEDDINATPQKYLKSMIKICRLLEYEGKKTFQFFPIRTSLIPKNITLDTASLVDIFFQENKNEYLDNISLYKEEIWGKIFNMQDPIFHRKNAVFDYSIMTDGYSVSIRFLKKQYIEANKKKKDNKQNAGKKSKELYKDLSEEEIQKIKNEKSIKDKQKKAALSKAAREKKKEFKHMSKEQQCKILENAMEFIYIHQLAKKKRRELRTAKKVYADTGKRSLLYMIDDEGNTLNYTNATRVRGTKRLIFQERIEKLKNKEKINEIENQLCKYNSKTTNFEWFKCYIEKKIEIDEELRNFYHQEVFRKLKWYAYINKKREEANMLNMIEKKYGKDIIIIIGDWNDSGGINYMSTPGVGLRRKLAERFKVYLIDEFRTSCLHNKTEERCSNLYLEHNNKVRKLHSVLTYRMNNKRLGCINRDKNAVLNMRKIVHHFLETGERLERYRRGINI
ncbi:MAG: hypothetical protein Hyperionvirus6_18 [Hyperionvirus sp.]|uniref:Uncharacterized protein n=1 Tax=Hyperionvirus sp. TaxID=2487770 RepID=A0A3G5A7W4_9VIRU|nr:MAG: hypothetical protein Hyperionvirus6_18 [Hyperionvirus sp.]